MFIINNMSRPKKCRCVNQAPIARFFKPSGIRMRDLQCVDLSEEGLEALRLVDVEGMEQVEAAKLMNVSRPTFSRVLKEARKTVAKALVEGSAIKIGGGNFVYTDNIKVNMKEGLVAITAKGLDDEVTEHFGRAPHFIIVDLSTKELVKDIDNSDASCGHSGVGVSTASKIADCGIKAVITGKTGPKATDILNQSNIKIFTGFNGKIAKEAIDEISNN
jgi:predicted DNA-binding protein (UPF0251 family)/predicted Fe-Mo cluster-binding NifX family protein